MPNFKPHGRHVRPCCWIFKFCKFWRKKKEIESFDVNSENSSPKGFFWPNKIKFVNPLLSADSRYFRTYALKKTKKVIQKRKKLHEIRKVARRTKSCSTSEKLLKSCRAAYVQPYVNWLQNQRCTTQQGLHDSVLLLAKVCVPFWATSSFSSFRRSTSQAMLTMKKDMYGCGSVRHDSYGAPL